MTTALLSSLAEVAGELRRREVRFALVGGIAVSLRAEPRFTAHVDLAIAVEGDEQVERLVRDLRVAGFEVRALVERETRGRIATVRLRNRLGVVVDLIAANSGIEAEVVEAAHPVVIDEAGEIPVATAEDLLAMKVLSTAPHREQDRLDARNLLLVNRGLDLAKVRSRLEQIASRGFDRGEDLRSKLEGIVADAESEGE